MIDDDFFNLWNVEDSINDVALQMIEEDRVSAMVETLQQAYPAMREISHAFEIPSEHLSSFRALIHLASRMEDLVSAQMRIFHDPRD